MNEEEFSEKIKELTDDIRQDIIDKAIYFFNSGWVDTERYGNDFRLPKIILSATFEHYMWEYMPLDHMDKTIVKNLKSF